MLKWEIAECCLAHKGTERGGKLKPLQCAKMHTEQGSVC